MSLGCPLPPPCPVQPSSSSPPASAQRRASASLSACAPLSAPPKSWLKAGRESRRPWAQMPPGGSCGNQPRSRASAKGRNCAFALGESTSDLLVVFFFFFFVLKQSRGSEPCGSWIVREREGPRREERRRGGRK